jgi:hypothetical protein
MPEPVELTAFLRSLRAVRRFSSVAVPDMVLHDILEVARWTGSAKNSQPWHLIVIRERATLETLAKCGPFAGHLARAKLAIALVMETGNQRFDEGIGSIYPEANTRRAKQLLSVPDTRWLHTAISFGYPADPRALRLSAERGSLTEVPIGRRHLASLVSWERYGAGPTLN